MSGNSIRALVTAVGGDFGQALVKALRLSAESFRIDGCDVDGGGIGEAFVDSFHILPPARDPDYTSRLDVLCRSLGVDAVVPGSEAEIAALGRLGRPPRLPGGAVIVCQPAAWVDAYGDKLNCMNALAGQVELSAFADGGDLSAVDELVEAVGFPVIVKSRRSSGSKSLRTVKDRADLSAALREVAEPLVQQYIDGSAGEFSAGVFVGRRFSDIIVFKRELGAVGCSWYAETSDDAQVVEYVEMVAKAVELSGSANIQVRKGVEGVRLLEINPRFSSLVAARAFCGFKDAEWSLLEALGLDVAAVGGAYKEIRFRRFFHELIDEGSGFRAVAEWQPKVIGGE